jgi:tripartite-type tricarboxylate transporter receptor subunit TctC
MASAGNGSAPHMAGELFKMMAGVDLVQVALSRPGAGADGSVGRRGSRAVRHGARHHRLHQNRKIARARGDHPDLPTVADFVPGYEASQWYGMAAPAGTPQEIIEKLNREINAAIADPAMKARLGALGGEPLPGSPSELGELIADETEKWARVVRAAGVKPE